MAKIVWDDTGKRLYETGTRRGVLFKKRRVAEGAQAAGTYGVGVPWNGWTGATFSPSGAEETALYANDKKYLSLYSAEDMGATLTAYTYPDEWAECDGSYEVAQGVTIGQQPRVGFGFTCRTTLGNDSEGNSYGYKLHLLYNAMASPSERAYSTINDSPEAVEFSWEVTTTPTDVDTDNDITTAYICIDSTKSDPDALAALEAILYGSENTDPRLPLPDEVVSIMSGAGGGATGSTGSTGTTGETGSTGSTGTTGETGMSGETGN